MVEIEYILITIICLFGAWKLLDIIITGWFKLFFSIGVLLHEKQRKVLGKKMKVIIAGDRHLEDFNLLMDAIKHNEFEITEVVSGCAKGVDKMGEMWANMHKIPIKRFPAKWERYGKAAGPLRNEQMANYADGLLAIYDPNESKGTKDMIKAAKRHKLKIDEYIFQYV